MYMYMYMYLYMYEMVKVASNHEGFTRTILLAT